jgi:L,D-transpeptidase catalytic domain
MPMLYSCVMRPFRISVIGFGALLACLAGADAAVVIHVDKSSQKMSVEVDGAPRYEFAVSTGRAGYGTPNGTYHPQRLERTWFSKEYYDSPMPYSIFFNRGFAIHGSYEIRHLGGPASHGCIRLHPSNAAKLFALVKEEGVANTTIVVSGSNPPGRREVEEADAGPRTPRYAPPGAWWGYNRPYAGYGYGRAYPSYPSYPSYPRGWYGGGGPFGY